MTPASLAVRGLVKSFAGVRALDSCDLTVAGGTVHGLVGQNGAGKSTLIKILAGLQQPDAGTVTLSGTGLLGPDLPQFSPAASSRAGIGVIHQERLLAASATVAEALFLGREPRWPLIGLLDRRELRARARDAFHHHFDLELPVDALVGELAAGQQQILQITRALLDHPRLLVFDEPTASLMQREVELMAGIVGRLKRDGITILYVSHYLAEIERLCDRVTVMRNGRDAGTVVPRDVPLRRIVEMMVGRDVASMFPPRDRVAGKPVLELRGVSRSGAFENVSFAAHAGEIVGITGILGCGGKRLLRALFGAPPATGGAIAIDGAPVRIASPRAAIASGIVLVPEDRRREGVAGRLTVRENVTLPNLRAFGRGAFLDRAAQDRAADTLIAQLSIKADGREQSTMTLSGGNQQKVVLAKWLGRGARAFLFDEPTVGVDIAAKVEIYTQIANLVARGACAVVFSSDLEELLGLTDRVLVMYRGTIVAEHVAAQADAALLLSASTGALAA